MHFSGALGTGQVLSSHTWLVATRTQSRERGRPSLQKVLLTSTVLDDFQTRLGSFTAVS